MPPYPSSKRMVERKHRHIVELGLTLLAIASLPYKFWDHAFLTAVYLINRLPTAALQFQVPYTLLYHKIHDCQFLKIFGCACYPLLRPYNAHKFQFRSQECVFLGYSNSHKGYKCLPADGRIYLSKDVIFNEVRFPYSSLFPIKTQSVTTYPISSIIPIVGPTPSSNSHFVMSHQRVQFQVLHQFQICPLPLQSHKISLTHFHPLFQRTLILCKHFPNLEYIGLHSNQHFSSLM